MLNKKIMRLTAMFIAVSVLLCGCGKKPANGGPEEKGPDTGEQSSTVQAIAQDGTWKGQGGCFNLEKFDLMDGIFKMDVWEDNVYGLGFTDENGMAIYLGEKVFYEDSRIQDMEVGEKGVCIISDISDYNVSSTQELMVILLGHDGQVMWESNITSHVQDNYTKEIRVNQEGQIFILLSSGSVIVLSQEGTFLCSITLEDMVNHLILGGDGKIYAATSKPKENSVFLSQQADKDEKIWFLNVESKSAELTAEIESIKVFDGGAEYLFSAADDNGLYGLKEASGQRVPIALWAELGISLQNISEVYQMKEDRYLIRNSSLAAILTPADPGDIKVKTVITIASVVPWVSLDQEISDFNFKNQNYMLKKIDYSLGDTRTLDQSIQALNMDIMAGNYPDLFDLTMLPEAYYYQKGLLEEIYALMDGEPDMQRDKFMLLDKLETDGKLYFVSGNYALDTGIGLKSRFGESFGWSLDDYLKIQSENSGEIMYNVTRKDFLRNIAYQYVAEAIDWSSGTCDFESQEFIKILNATAKVRENPESQNPSELDFTPAGKRLSTGSLIVASWYMDNVRSVAAARAEVGEEISFPGMPTLDGSSGTQLYLNNSAAICSKGNVDGAWEFIKYIMTDGARESRFGISVNKEVLEAQTAESMKPAQEEGMVAASEKDKEQFYELLDHAVYYSKASETVINIILEEAEAFLKGAKTAEDTARIIQSRVSILAAE